VSVTRREFWNWRNSSRWRSPLRSCRQKWRRRSVSAIPTKLRLSNRGPALNPTGGSRRLAGWGSFPVACPGSGPASKGAIAEPLRDVEYAYQTELRKLDDDSALIECADLKEFYTRLAHVLARRVLDRERKGLHRAYEGRCERRGGGGAP